MLISTKVREGYISEAPGEYIRELMEEKGLSKQDLCLYLSKDMNFINRLLDGLAPIDYILTIDLAEYLGYTPRYWELKEYHYMNRLKGNVKK